MAARLRMLKFCTSVALCCTIFLCYMGKEIDYQCRDPMNNDKDDKVGYLTSTFVNFSINILMDKFIIFLLISIKTAF